MMKNIACRHAHSPLWCRSLRPQPKATPQQIDWVRACKSSGLQTSRLAANHDLLRAAIGLRHCTLGEQYLSGVGKFTTVVENTVWLSLSVGSKSQIIGAKEQGPKLVR